MMFFISWRVMHREKQNKMSPFLSFVRKEFYHIFRDKTTTAILLALPVLMLMLFGYAITTEVKNSRVAVYDPSNDLFTRAVIEKLNASEYFTVVKMLKTSDEINEQFRKGEVKMVIAFSEKCYQNMLHTGTAQVALIVDGTDPNSSKAVVGYASAILAQQQQDMFQFTNIPFQVQPEIKLLYNPTMKGAYNFVPGVMGMILMLICAMMTSISIAKEKEMGTMEVLLVSPVKPSHIILAKTIPYFVLSLINLSTILLISVFILGVPVAGSLFWLLMLSLVYILVNLSLGLVISSVVDNQQTALLISGMVLMLPVIMLSGMMFPVENMPVFFQWISQVIPAKWYIIGVKKIMIKGLGFEAILPQLSVLLGMAILLIGVSIKKFRYRLE